MQTFNNEILDILRDLKHNNTHVTLRNISDFLDGVDAYFFNCELKEIRAGNNYNAKALNQGHVIYVSD